VLPETPSLHPDLPWSVDALILDALRDRLRADQPLLSVFSGDGGDSGIVIVERRVILTQETLPHVPLLALSLYTDREGRGTSSYGAEQETVVEIALLTNPPKELGDCSEHLRSRIVARTRAVIRQEAGALYTAADRLVATAQTNIDRVNFDEASLPSQLVLTIMRVTYRTDIHLLTQEVIE
jgi:hypothetical protein